jgi:hypothetical protein
MKRINGISFDQVMDELSPNGRIEVWSPVPIHPDAQFTWRGRVPGRGVYLGAADEYTDEKGEKFMTFADPDAFIPEN